MFLFDLLHYYFPGSYDEPHDFIFPEDEYENIYFNLILKSSKICLLLIKTLINKLITVVKVRRFKCHLKLKQKVMHIIKVI